MGKLVVLLIFLGSLGGAAWFVHERGVRGAARATAHGLKAGWDWVASLQEKEKHSAPVTQKPVRHSPAPARAVAKAPPPPTHAIVPQQHKESLKDEERAALDKIIHQRR